MTDVTSVTATAIVRARDGSSIADWDDTSTVPPDHYLADPDRIAAAIDILEGAGLTVNGVGDVTITFSGTADTIGTTFAATVDTTDLDRPTWGGTPPVGGPELIVAAGHRLAAQLATVRLESRPNLERTYGLTRATAGEIRPLDLYVGEVGQTLGSAAELPDRLKAPHPIFQLPAIDTATRQSLADWRPKLRAARAAANVVKRHRRTTINIVEGSGGPTVRSLLQDYNILGDPPLVVHSTSADPRDIYHLPNVWTTYRGPMAEAVLEWLDPAELRARGHADDVQRWYLRFVDDPSETNEIHLRRALGELSTAVTVVARHLDYLKARGFALRIDPKKPHPEENPSPIDVADLRVKAAALAERAAGRSIDFDQIPDLFNGTLTPLRFVRNTLRILAPRMLDDRANAVFRADYHAQMVAWAVNGVTLGSVPASLRGNALAGYHYWDPRFDTSGAQRGEQDWPNNVLSASWGSDVATNATWSRDRAWFTRARAVGLANPRTLHVIAVGNKQDTPTRPSSNAFLAGAANVILVGGCEPAVEHGQLVWKGTEATQGFAYRIGATTHHVPDICATTKGDNGGSMIYPGRLGWAGASAAAGVGQQVTWWTGGGSSLSCPIVAAVAGLVWTAFPELSAPELKDLLVATAAPLDGGAFHYPAGFTRQEQSNVAVAGSNQAGPGAGPNRHPAGRVHLWDAFAGADRIYRQRFGRFDPRLLGRKAEAGR